MSMSFPHAARKVASLKGVCRPVFAALLVPVIALCFFLVTAALSTAAPPTFAVENKCQPSFTVTNKIPPCGCGCMTGAPCQCRNCCERTADPNWKPAQSAASVPATADQWVQVCGPEGCRLSTQQPGAFSYAQPSQFGGSIQSFSGGCASGACGSSSSSGSAAGSCGSGHTGWYPGKALGRPLPRRFR